MPEGHTDVTTTVAVAAAVEPAADTPAAVVVVDVTDSAAMVDADAPAVAADAAGPVVSCADESDARHAA
ncbi:hypothetical protein ACGF1Z_20275 [Streptomyces sp. NPDC048018]|uniref:hypothetical protein n=1 Tax=Streptomyces sp. NPDC048018 TaxID=3365499 RepID=UPI00371B2E04